MTATNWMSLACVVVAVKRTPMQMASVTTWTIVWASLTRVVCAMAPARFTSADAQTFQKAIAIARAISPQNSKIVWATVFRIWTATASAMTKTTVWTSKRRFGRISRRTTPSRATR